MVISSEEAFAALLTDGSVVAWGDDNGGGNPYSTSEYASPPLDPADLASGVVKVVASEDAFAALKLNGRVVAWGDDYSGGNPYSIDEDASPPLDPADLASGVVEIVANDSAFAALKTDGSVVAWGADVDGGNPSSPSSDAHAVAPASLASGVVEIVAAKYAFAARKEDGSVVAWGHEPMGGNAEEDGVGEWGSEWFGAPAGSLDSDVVKVVGANYSFAAIKDDGRVVAWGKKASGGSVYASGVEDGREYSGAPAGSLDSYVVEVIASRQAFAALKSDGSVVTWGASRYGGNSTTFPSDSVDEYYKWMPAPSGSLDSDVVKVVMYDYGFAALKNDGSVVVWGGLSEYGLVAYLDPVASELLADVVDIRVRPEMYGSRLDDRDVLMVYKSGGRVVLVGPPAYVDSTTTDGFVETEWDRDLYAALPEGSLSSGVVDVTFSWESGAVLKDDGSVVTWGRVRYGGGGDRTDLPIAEDAEADSYTMAPAGSLSSGVVEILANVGSFSARKADGSVVTWGRIADGGDSSTVATALDGLSSEWAADCPLEAGGTCSVVP
jgi:alpha-tubulin suppressor-like RCC1 family protein